MSDAPREQLVILESRLANSALAELRTLASVTQVLPPRLALVRSDRATTARIAQIPGVLAVHDQTLGAFPRTLRPRSGRLSMLGQRGGSPRSGPATISRGTRLASSPQTCPAAEADGGTGRCNPPRRSRCDMAGDLFVEERAVLEGVSPMSAAARQAKPGARSIATAG